MDNFYFEFPTKIYFGKGQLKNIGSVFEKQERVLIIYGSDRIVKSGCLGEIKKALKSKGIVSFEEGGVQPNPRLSKVIDLVKICHDKSITWLLALGGGSVMDTAKAVALGMEDPHLWDYFDKKATWHLPVRIKIGVIPTIAASGSETSSTTVITNDLLPVWEKKAFSFWMLKPKFAIMDPTLTMSVSWEETACGGIDIFSHVLERYFTHSLHNELTDSLCEATMRTIIHQLKILKEGPDNYNARAELFWAGTIAHSNFLSVGRSGDWAMHSIEHELSAIYDIRHGTGLSILIPAWMYYVYEDRLTEFGNYAQKVWSVSSDEPKAQAELGIKNTIEFFKELGQPVKLSDVGINEINVSYIAQRAAGEEGIGNFVRLYAADIEKILLSAVK